MPEYPNIITLAHPGGQDFAGGHTNHKTGTYHFHHGETEHQHVLGYCTIKHQFLGFEGPIMISCFLGLLGYYFLLRQKKIAGLN